MPKDNPLRPFYPELSPNQEYRLKVSELHEIYFASYGNPAGIPAIALHGGPGAGTQPYMAQFFDPQKYHIILADQRGSGKSTPKGEIKENTTAWLIEDIETIRNHLNIDKWVVFGGSWGSTLALLYGQAHPERVLGLILRGIFLARPHDVSAFTRNDTPAAFFHSVEWAEFKKDTQALIAQAGLEGLSVEVDDIYGIYYHLLNCQNPDVAENAAGTIAAWEKYNSFLQIDKSELAWSRSPDGVNMGLMEAFYFKNNSFIEENQILRDVRKLRDIPTHIIHGAYDLICPAYQADELEKALLEVNDNKDLVVRYNPVAGHSHKEEGNRDALIQALDTLADQLSPKQESTEELSFASGFFKPSALPRRDEETSSLSAGCCVLS